jgi:hypothetical protein
MDMLQRDSSFVFAAAQNRQAAASRQHPHIELNAYRPVAIPLTGRLDVDGSVLLADERAGQVKSR